MDLITIIILSVALIGLIVLSGFFSSSETAMMAINRYRLRHLARHNNRAAIRVNNLLKRTDRLLGVILIGNTFANILASSLATFLAVHFFGDLGIAIATFVLTFIILIFAEVAPKTLAAVHAEKLAFAVSLPLKILLSIFYPIVWSVNLLANSLLTLLRFKIKRSSADHLTSEEFETLVKESGGKISRGHQEMLLAILALERVFVDDIMIPRNDIVGIDWEQDWSEIRQQITFGHHTKVPVYQGDIDNLKGLLHVRNALHLLAQNQLTREAVLQQLREPYFIPEGTPLHTQLRNFRKQKVRTAFVVDEYGNIIGLLTMEDILEEIVGEYTTDIPAIHKEIKLQEDGSYIIDAAITIRELNKQINSDFDTAGPKTLSGFIIEQLELIPQNNVSIRVGNYCFEVLHASKNKIRKIKLSKLP